MSDRSRYRYVNFIGGRILQAREMAKLQGIARGFDDTNQPVAFDSDAVYRDGAAFNVAVNIAPGTATVTLSAVENADPMLVFVRGRWEQIHPADVPAITLSSSQSRLFLNWQLRRVTMAEDPQLTDPTTGEATAEMGQLDLQVSAIDDSSRLPGATEFEKNMLPIVLFGFAPTSNGVTVNYSSNIKDQALASGTTAGFVELTTSTSSGLAASADDPRLSDSRAPSDLSVTDAKVRMPISSGPNNADGTSHYDLALDPGGISSLKVVHQTGRQLVGDLLEWIKAQAASVFSLLTAHIGSSLGAGNSHPMPTAQQVGATPASHQNLSLGVPGSHPAVVATNKGGFVLNRTASVPAAVNDAAFGVLQDGGLLSGLLHTGDVLLGVPNIPSAAPLFESGEALTTGPLALLSTIAQVLAEHVNKTSHKNPHGLTLDDVGGVSQFYVDSRDQAVFFAAKNYIDSKTPAVAVQFVPVVSGAYLLISFAPNGGNPTTIGYGVGRVDLQPDQPFTIPTPDFSFIHNLPQFSFFGVGLQYGDIAAINTSESDMTASVNVQRFDGSGRQGPRTGAVLNWSNLCWRGGAPPASSGGGS